MKKQVQHLIKSRLFSFYFLLTVPSTKIEIAGHQHRHQNARSDLLQPFSAALLHNPAAGNVGIRCSEC